MTKQAHPHSHVVALVANGHGARFFEQLIHASRWIEVPPLAPGGRDHSASALGRRIAVEIDQLLENDPWIQLHVIATHEMLDQLHSMCSPNALRHVVHEEEADLVDSESRQLRTYLDQSCAASIKPL